MLTGGFADYPDGVMVAEVSTEPLNDFQVMLHAIPRLYDSQGGTVVAVLPFDPTPIGVEQNPEQVVDEAICSWVIFRHMLRS